MDLTTLAGLLLAFAGILGGQLLEGGSAGSLLQAAALLIVLCGTFGAVMVQTQMSAFMEGLAMAHWALFPPLPPQREVLRQVLLWAGVARREGLLALEARIAMQPDAFARKGLQLLVDGVDARRIRDVLQIDVVGFEERQRRAARIWDAAGGYAPTIGILGAVLGLIHVMENLTDPARLGGGIAVAFVATIYGVGLANLVFLPIGSKLKTIIVQQVVAREMLVDGLMGIADGDNPRLIESKLAGYLQ